MRNIARTVRRAARRWHWRKAPLILLYHRVAEVACDPWQLAVSPDHFNEQIDALARTRRVVPLRDLRDEQERWSPRDKPLAAVTFDDGYLDVFSNARPVLHRHDCPATVFVTTGIVDTNREFWWEALTGILLDTSSLPASLVLRIDGCERVWPIAPGRERRVRELLYRDVWAALRPLPVDRRNRHMEEIAHWAGCMLAARPEHAVMTSREVADISDGLISVGAHTVTHPSLPLLDGNGKRREIADSKRACEEMTDRPVDLFAYPFGDYDRDSVEAVREAGFAFACTVEPSFVRPGADSLRLPRINVGDWDGDQFLNKLASVPFQ